MVTETKKRVQITFEKKLFDKLEEYCEDKGYTKSVAVDLAIRKLIKKG